jgi:prepilin-type N-terminal cleavage/methylation domain-containing protein
MRDLEDNGCGGFTLVELVATLVLVGVVASVAGMLIMQMVQGYGTARGNVVQADQADLALGRLARETRAATTITVGGATVSFTRDGTTRTVALDGTTLRLDGQPLMRNVAAFSAVRTGGLYTYDISSAAGAPTVQASVRRQFGVSATLTPDGLRDTLTGTPGRGETFVFSSQDQSQATINDFTPDEDILDVSGLLADLGYGGSDPFDDGTILISERRGNVTVSIDPDGSAGPLRAFTLGSMVGLALDDLDTVRDFYVGN